jgi:nicotinate-nucleotide adenylyltransferase
MYGGLGPSVVTITFLQSELSGGRFHLSVHREGAQFRTSMAPGDELFFLIGSDAFAEIRAWHRWKEVVEAVEFIVVSRPGHDASPPIDARVERLETLELPVSSTAIRDALRLGRCDVDVPPAVLDYIREHGLYRRGGL